MPARKIVFGFDPSETTCFVNRRVVSEHADEAGALWMQRRRAIGLPQYRLRHLARLDERVCAHLAGLQVAGEDGWRLALDTLASGDAGALFAVTYLAFADGDRERMRHALMLAFAAPEQTAAFLDALAWLPTAGLRDAMAALEQSPVARYRYVACCTFGAWRDLPDADPASDPFLRLAGDADPAVRARALQAAGELKLYGLQAVLNSAGRDPDAYCRFRSACALALMGQAGAAEQAFELGAHHPLLARESVDVALRCGNPDWARQTIRRLAADPAGRRLAILASGAFGDPATVPWLIECTADPSCAAVAGEAIATITGVDLEYLDLDGELPPDAPDAHLDDAHLPWPDSVRLKSWWAGRAGGFTSGVRYLAGRPVSTPNLRQVLRDGYQRMRASAAIELARIDRAAALFPVSARADWQLRRLAA